MISAPPATDLTDELLAELLAAVRSNTIAVDALRALLTRVLTAPRVRVFLGL